MELLKHLEQGITEEVKQALTKVGLLTQSDSSKQSSQMKEQGDETIDKAYKEQSTQSKPIEALIEPLSSNH